MDKLNVSVYLPFSKRNDEEQIVEGFASTEALDCQGEVVKANAIEEALPDYMKFGNIREMHTYSAVGKTISAEMKPKDASKGLYIVVKVVDDLAWKKVREGVYNGFSIGGRVLKRVGNSIEQLILNEISLVDRPANPEALFSLVKMQDGKLMDMQKGEVMTAQDQPQEDPHQNVFMASHILELAADLVYIYEYYQVRGKETKSVEAIIQRLRDLAASTLTESADKKKFDAILNNINKGWVDGYMETLNKVL